MVDSRKIEKLEQSAVKMTVTVSAEGAEKAYNDLLSRYGKQVQIPGFRKGKVPRSVLIRKFGEGIRQEAASDVIDAALKEALDGVEKNPISQPVLEDLPALEPGSPYEFTITYDVFPEIKMGEYKGIEIEEDQVKILKKHEDEELEAIREQNAIVAGKADGVVSDRNIVTMDYVELAEDGSALEETRREGFVFTLGTNPHPYQFEDDVKGMKKDETRVIEKTYGDDAPSHLAGRSLKIEAVVTAVKERRLPGLDDELAQDVSEDLKTLDDLRRKVKADLKERAAARIRSKKTNTIIDKIADASEIDVPKSMIDSDLENTWRDYVRQSGTSEDMLIKALEDDGRNKADILEQWHDDAAKSVKTSLILGKIVEEEKIEASDDEVTAELRKRAEEFRMEPEELEKMFGGPQFREYLKSELAQTKLFDFLLEAASFKEGGKIDYTDLMGA